jgi:hypothetical protein
MKLSQTYGRVAELVYAHDSKSCSLRIEGSIPSSPTIFITQDSYLRSDWPMDEVEIIKKRLTSQNRKGLALDVDETLSWTVGYWIAEMQARFGNPESLSVEELIAK